MTQRSSSARLVTRAIIILALLCPSLAGRTFSRYALLLQDPPASDARSVVRIGMGPEVLAARTALRQKQNALRAELLRRKVNITGSTQLLVNAIYVAAVPTRVAELSGLPGVRRVVFLPPVRPSLDHAEQLVNTAGAWTLLGGISSAGLGMKIAVIDSGIDQTHPAFQDPSLVPPDGFPICNGSDCAFTSSKIIAARSYIPQQGAGSSDDPAADSRPDDFSPRDHQGHGTAVAMIVAGVTNTGPGDTITGFAPKAFLGSYKIFGSPGVNDEASSDVLIMALEDAVADGMDIANLSLGGPAFSGPFDSGAACGEADGVACDPLSLAVENATSLGLLVVAAAGNDAVPGSIESPGIAPSAIAVGATTNSHVWQFQPQGFTSIDVGVYNIVDSFSSRGPSLGLAAIKPDIAAVGDNLFLTAENYDPYGELYNPLRYTISQGTSFSTPMVAGSAALVKQAHPAWQPWQIKSALVNTASQDVMSFGQPASVTAVGGGKLNAGNAVAAALTVNPPAASFGVLQSLPVTLTFQVRNDGADATALQLSLSPRTADNNASISLSPSGLTLAPGASAQFTASLGGVLPVPGSYEGFIVLQNGTSTLRIPYLYLVSDGVPTTLIPLLGSNGIGLPGQEVPDGMLAFEVVDQFGLPVPHVPVGFAVLRGGGQIGNSDGATNVYGIATAQAFLGPSAGNNVFSGSAAGRIVQFPNTAVLQPVISGGGVVNAASFLPGPGIAPGSYVSIFGANLSPGSNGEVTPNLPVSIRGNGFGVSVSFDVPEAHLSLPGHLIYVSPKQVNVQVPWELSGQSSVRMKVSIETASGAVSTVPVAEYSPGIFSYPSGDQSLAIAQDSAFASITTDHPAVRGQIVTLYGTGFGPVNHTPAGGDPAPDSSATTLVNPVVAIGGVDAPVLFSGLAPGFAGLYQINVTVPTDTAAGLQPVTVSANGIAANPTLLPIQ